MQKDGKNCDQTAYTRLFPGRGGNGAGWGWGTAFVDAAGNGTLLQTSWPAGFRLSLDGGATWRAVKIDVHARKVYFFDGKQLIGTNGG